MSRFVRSLLAARSSRASALAFVVLLASGSPLRAQGVKVKEEKAGMLKQAKVSPEAATATALAKVPGGKVSSVELENEDGKLIYSFDIKVAGKSGIYEVGVDAMTGAVIGVEHETPADESKEAAADKAKADKAKADKAKATKVTPPVKRP